ncbi:hypothetical protein [Devosia aurantiaca]|uniref:Uncharacterized protein n=1 Tax=Devosia aurantiaca TaxID=2714858 RepID=A0A6M1SIH4_9HYPH|nr:hypothetical protein [Devosia aurantiaca]NGP19267.1 hypothetical protein [Devosia aurantiaca]
MPTEYQPTGAEIVVNGKRVPATAPIYLCEGCGYRGAPFQQKRGDELLSYCGWNDGRPVCIGKGRAS